jgi:5,10-methylenetetrahydromethanopterin reductase
VNLAVGLGLYLTGPIAEAVELIQLAEQLGFRSAWVNDSQCTGREAGITLGAAAAATRRIRLGTAVTNPFTRHLTVTASAFYSLDELSGGRAALGLGRGELSVRLTGTRRASYAELEHAVRTLRALLAGESVVFDGHPVRLAPAAASPRHIPIYVSAIGPRSLRLAGQVADGVILTVGAHPADVAAALATVEDGARSVGRSLADLHVVARVAYSSAAGDEALRWVSPHVTQILLQPGPFSFAPADAAVVEELRGAYAPEHHLERHHSPAALVNRSLGERFALLGVDEACRARVRALAAQGVHELSIVPLGPDLSTVTRAFATEVLTRL